MQTTIQEHTTQSKTQAKTFVAPVPVVQKKIKEDAQIDQKEAVTEKAVTQKTTFDGIPNGNDQNTPRISTGALIQRKCADCGDEEQEPEQERVNIQTKKKTHGGSLRSLVQTKLAIGQVDDKYEKEADYIADNVVQMDAENTVQTKLNSSGSLVQLKCKACEEYPPKLQLKAEQKGSTEYASDSLTETLSSRAGSGNSIETTLQTDLGSKMGVDFGNVQIHTDSKAVAMNEELGAHAFTHGADIYFNRGMYNPNTKQGKHLLVHELTHVIQQTGSLQAFRPPQIQKFDAHDEIQEKLRAKDSELITEAPIPGGQTTGKGFTKFGYADLYKSKTPAGVFSGIYGAKHRTEVDEDTQITTEKYAYKNVSSKALLHTPKGTFTKAPEITHSAVSVYEMSDGSKKYFKGTTEVPETSKGTLITGGFPSEFFVGDIKKGDDNLTLAKVQISNYKKGFRDFTKDANRHFGISQTQEGEGLTDLKIPDGLNYAEFNTQNATLGDGNLTNQTSTYNRRYWLYPHRSEGIYLYIWLPHPWTNYVPKFQRKGKDVIDELDELNKRFKVKGKKPTKSIDTKRKTVNPKPKALPITQKKGKKGIQKKDTDWKKHRTEYVKARKKWKTDYGNKYLKNKDIDKVVESKVDFDKRVGISKTAHGDFGKVTKQFNRIEFWASYKGQALGELRFLLGDKFDILADKFEGMKERTKKTRAKANKLSGSMSFGWKKKVIGLLMKGFKAGFSLFIAETFAVFSACIGGMIDKFQDGFSEMEEMEQMLAELEKLQTEIETLINEVTTKYDAQMKLYEEILVKMEDIKFYAEILSTAETLIRIGVQVVSCLSPPALGCLWGLVAQIGLEAALSLVMGTQWFEDEFMKPLVKKLIDNFLKDDILAFMNKLFTDIGLGDYIKDVDACKVSPAASGGGGGVQSWYIGNPTIPPSRYKSHAALWEAKNKSTILGEITTAFSQGTTGKKVTDSDIEEFMKTAQDKKMKIEDFKAIVKDGEVGDNKFNLDTVKGSIDGYGAEGDTAGDGTSDAVLIDASKVANDDDTAGSTEDSKGRMRVQAESSHTKGSKPNLTIFIFEGDNHIATAVNVPSEVTKRKWFPSDQNRKKLQIYYFIPKKIPLVKGYFISKGRTIRGYAKP